MMVEELIDAIEKLKKLNPEERLKRLRALRERELSKLKKADELIKSSKEELQQIQKEKTQMPIPELKELDITSLFNKEQGLDSQVKENQAQAAFDQHELNFQYQQNLTNQLNQAPSDSIYKIVEGIYQGFKSTGYISSDQMTVMNSALEASIHKMDSIKSGDYLPTKEASNALVSSMKMAKFLQDRYKA